MPINEESIREKKEATVRSIVEATGLLLKEKMVTAPHAREIAKKSGYSLGTIYNYFSSVGAVVSHLVLHRQMHAMRQIEQVMNSHDPDSPIEVFCKNVIDAAFSSWEDLFHNPMAMRFAYRFARSHGDNPEAHEKVAQVLVKPILAAAARDRTGTFRKVDEQEAQLYLFGVTYLGRMPLLEENPFFATQGHRDFILDFLIKSFAKTAVAKTAV